MMPELTTPTPRLHTAWLEAHREWGPGLHEDGFGLREADEIESAQGFFSWIERLNDQADPTLTLEAGSTPCTYRWITEGTQVLGGIALRHEYTDLVARLGHIGFGIRPSARRRGLATWALEQMLETATELSLERVLIICEANNIPSAKVIENHGGVLEEAPFPHHELRYWINMGR
jgi:predicted acetyltransferase